MSQQFYDETETPNVVEFELEKTYVFRCANCRKAFMRLKAFEQVLNSLWCNKCAKERDEQLAVSPVGVYFGQ